MPLTFGMEGDKPPKLKNGEQDFGFGGPPWWRAGGDFSRPLLANSTFRKLFLAKIKELLDTTYTQKAIFPLIESMGKRLEDEVKFRAELRKEDPKDAVKRLNKNLDSLREHVEETPSLPPRSGRDQEGRQVRPQPVEMSRALVIREGCSGCRLLRLPTTSACRAPTTTGTSSASSRSRSRATRSPSATTNARAAGRALSWAGKGQHTEVTPQTDG